MSIESENNLIFLREIRRIVANCLKHMALQLQPGIATLELDEVGKLFLNSHDAQSAPKLSYNFPGTTCISVNEEAAHGILSAQTLNAGDLVNIDVSAELGGYFADTGGSFIIPPESDVKRNNLSVIENLGSHGVGRALHEELGFIQNYYDPKDQRILRENPVITIEPFLSTGARQVFDTGDG